MGLSHKFITLHCVCDEEAKDWNAIFRGSGSLKFTNLPLGANHGGPSRRCWTKLNYPQKHFVSLTGLTLEEYIFNKHYNHDTVDLVFEALSKIFQHRVFIFEESLTNSPRGIVGEKYNRCINVLERGDHYNLIVVNEKGWEKANNRLDHSYSRSVLLFNIFFCFIFTTALLKRCWFVFTFSSFT